MIMNKRRKENGRIKAKEKKNRKAMRLIISVHGDLVLKAISKRSFNISFGSMNSIGTESATDCL